MTGYGAPQPQQRSGQQLPLFDLIGAGLGVLSFVWGFLPWYKGSVTQQGDTKGYAIASPGAAAIGLSLLASFVAAGVLIDKKAKPGLVPIGAAASSLLVTFGLLVAKGDGVDTKIGIILMLITAVAQVGLFVAGWLQAEGKIMTGASSTPPAGQWGGGGGQWGGYQQPGYQQPVQPQPPQSQYGQQPPPPQPQYGQPTQHQAPPQPQYGQPTQHQSQAPQGYPQQPPTNPYGQG